MKRTHTIRVAVLVAATALLAAACGPRPTPGPPPAPTPPPAPVEARFVSRCTFSHAASDDPIVFPGQPGVSHLHHFVGNTTTNAFSTYESLRAAPGTTCTPSADKTAYWQPALLVDGVPLAPQLVSFYARGHRASYQQVVPFPAGLRFIAGSAHAMSPQGQITSWSCVDNSGNPSVTSAEVPTCAAGTVLRLRLVFPNCWDGVNLDSGDHKSHMSYAVNGRCDAGHPILVPQITALTRYPTQGGPGVTLASGGQYSAHADFFNAWDQAVLTARVVSCINAGIACKADGTPEVTVDLAARD